MYVYIYMDISSTQVERCGGYMALVVCVTKKGNIVPRAGIEPRSLAFQTSVLTITPRRLP